MTNGMAGRFLSVAIALSASIFVSAHAHAATPGLDAESLGCMACHAGLHEEGFSHPVGMDYGEVSGKDRSLAPPASLDKRLRLVDGRVSCVTCHARYVKETHDNASQGAMLVIDNEASGLCLACHRK